VSSRLRLLETSERGTGGWRSRRYARGVVMNDAGFFAAVASLTGLTHDDRDSGGKVCVKSGLCTGCRRIRYGSTLRLVVELVAALLVGKSGQSVVEKNRTITSCKAQSSESWKIGWVSVAVGGRIRDSSSRNRSQVRETGSLIRRQASAEQIRNCDRGDDEDDGDNDQQLNQ